MCYRVDSAGKRFIRPQSCNKDGSVYPHGGQSQGTAGRIRKQCFARKSKEPVDECKPKDGPMEDPNFFDQVQPCGYYKEKCPNLTVIFANTDYPRLPGKMPSLRYIVQVDIGTSPNENCSEMIVKGNVDWGPIHA